MFAARPAHRPAPGPDRAMPRPLIALAAPPRFGLRSGPALPLAFALALALALALAFAGATVPSLDRGGAHPGDEPGFLAAAPRAVLADGAPLQRLGAAGGGVFSHAHEGDTAWLGVGYSVWAVDLSVASAPRAIGRSELLPSPALDIVVREGIVVAAMGSDGLIVLDGGNRASPTVAARLPVEADAIAQRGDLLFALRGSSLSLVDLSVPSAPRLIGLLRLPGRAAHIALDGDASWLLEDARTIGAGLQLHRLDVSDPARPTLASTARFNADRPLGMDVRGADAFVVTSAGELIALDVTDPARARERSRVLVPLGAASTGPRALIAGTTRVWVSSASAVAEIDMTNPGAPRPLGLIEAQGSISGLSLRGADQLLIACLGDLVGARRAYHGLEIFNIAAPADARSVGALRDAWHAYGVAAKDDLAYVAAGRAGMRIVDLSDPSAPRTVGRYEAEGVFVDVALHGSVAYLADGSSRSAFRVVDVAEPILPRELLAIDSPGALAAAVEVSAGRLAVGLELQRVAVFDLADPRAPVLVGSVPVPGRVLDLSAVGAKLYVASALAGQAPHLTVIDMGATPPISLGAASLAVARGPGGLVGLAAEGERVYVTADGGVIVFDATNPEAIVERGRVPLPGFGVGLAAAAGYVYTAAADLSIIDALVPRSPRVAATLPWPASWAEARNGIAVQQGRVLVGHWEAGLLVASANVAPLPTFTPTLTPPPSPTAPPTVTPTPAPTLGTPALPPTAPSTATPTVTPTATLVTPFATDPPSPTATTEVTSTHTPAPSVSATAAATGSATDVPAAPSATTIPPASATIAPPRASATRTAGASSPPSGARRIFLPLALNEQCPPRDRFTDVVLVVDASRSMASRTPSGLLKIDAAIDGVWTFLDGLRLRAGADRAAIVTFNNQATVLHGMSHERARLVVSLRRVTLAEGTRIDLGIDRAVTLLAGSRRRDARPAIVVLSDGLVDAGSSGRVVSAAARARGAGMATWVVGVGPAMDAAMLRRVAGETSHFIAAPNPDGLRAVYQTLVSQVPCPSEAYWGRR